MKIVNRITLCVRYIFTVVLLGLSFLLSLVFAHQMLLGHHLWLIPYFISCAAIVGCIANFRKIAEEFLYGR